MKEVERPQPMVHRKRKQPQKSAVEFLSFWFAPEITLNGIENLEDTRELISEGKKIVFFSNHLSHADYPVFTASLKRNGYKDIEEKTIPLEGLRVDNTPVAKWFIPYCNTILIWPPTETPKDDNEKKKKLSMDKEMIKYTKLNLNNGYHLMIFPEGGRSKETRALKEGNPGAAHFLTLVDDTFIVPVGITGTEEILPPGSFVLNTGRPTITFGEPIRAAYLKELYGHLDNKNMRKEMIKFIMLEVANCLPPSYRGVYSNGAYEKQN